MVVKGYIGGFPVENFSKYKLTNGLKQVYKYQPSENGLNLDREISLSEKKLVQKNNGVEHITLSPGGKIDLPNGDKFENIKDSKCSIKVVDGEYYVFNPKIVKPNSKWVKINSNNKEAFNVLNKATGENILSRAVEDIHNGRVDLAKEKVLLNMVASLKDYMCANLRKFFK